MSEPIVISLDRATIKSVRADMVKQTVALTFELRLNEAMLAVKRDLSFLSIDAKPVSLSITETIEQLPLLETREFRALAEDVRAGRVTFSRPDK